MPPPELQDQLISAVCRADLPAIDAALAAGADFVSDEIQPLYYAAMIGSVPTLRHLFAHGHTLTAELPVWRAAFTDPPDERYAETAFHAAAEDSHPDALDILVQQPDATLSLDTFGLLSETPLTRAAGLGHLRCVQIFLAAGADVNAHAEPIAGYTPLDVAVMAGHPEIVRTLLAAGADPDIPTWMTVTARNRVLRATGEHADAIREIVAAATR